MAIQAPNTDTTAEAEGSSSSTGIEGITSITSTTRPNTTTARPDTNTTTARPNTTTARPDNTASSIGDPATNAGISGTQATSIAGPSASVSGRWVTDFLMQGKGERGKVLLTPPLFELPLLESYLPLPKKQLTSCPSSTYIFLPPPIIY